MVWTALYNSCAAPDHGLDGFDVLPVSLSRPSVLGHRVEGLTNLGMLNCVVFASGHFVNPFGIAHLEVSDGASDTRSLCILELPSPSVARLLQASSSFDLELF